MDILINQTQYNRLFINENRESKNLSKARDVVRQLKPNLNPMQVLNAIRTDIPASRENNCQFLPGVVRMYLQGQINDGATIGNLNKTLKILANAHANEYDQNLNNMSAQELIDRFKSAVRGDVEQKKAANAEREYSSNSQYKVVLIPDAETAAKYKDYVTWCVCHDERMYNSYTHEGMGVFYFLLKDGFQEVPKVEGSGCPLDEYGLSMVAVSINDDGSINTSTCRWNHDNGGNDTMFTDEQLSKMLGGDVYQILKPVGIEVLADNDQFKVFRKGNKTRLYNKKLDEYSDFVNGFARFQASYGGYDIGVVNLKGEIVVPAKYFSIGDYEPDGCFLAARYSPCIVTTDGRQIFNPDAKIDENTVEKITKATPAGTRVYTNTDNLKGLINIKLGKHIKPGTYNGIDYADSDGRFRVVKGKQCGLLNDDMTVALEVGNPYTWIDCCEILNDNPYRVVRYKDNSYNILDKNLNEVLPFKASYINDIPIDGRGFRLRTFDGRKGYFDNRDGHHVIDWSDRTTEELN